jgi:hypothetical protein
VKKNVPAHPNHLQLDAGRWIRRRINLQEISSSVTPSSKPPSPMHPHATTASIVVTIVDSLGIMQMTAQSPSRTSPTSRVKGQGPCRSIQPRSRWCKSSWAELHHYERHSRGSFRAYGYILYQSLPY